MSDAFILSNGTLVTGGGDPVVIPDGAVVWRGDRIVGVGMRADLALEYPGARTLDARKGLIRGRV